MFDGDLGLANVDVQLGLMPKRDLNDVIRGRLSLDKVIQHYPEGNFDIPRLLDIGFVRLWDKWDGLLIGMSDYRSLMS